MYEEKNKNEENERYMLSPEDLLKRLILEKREYVLESVRQFEFYRGHGSGYTIAHIRSGMIQLFLELQASLKASLKKEDYDKIKDNVYSSEYENLIESYEEINRWLYTLNFIRLDNLSVQNKERSF